jgi:hypothetical protein
MTPSATTIMSHGAVLRVPSRAISPARIFAAGALLLAGAAALLAGWAPLGFSIVTVFLFAGPHNWIELRYFLTRTPARWGRLRSFFLLAFGGVLILAGSFAAMSGLLYLSDFGRDAWLTILSVWNSGFIVWLAVLIWLRSRQNPRRDWSWVLPIAPLLIAAAWLFPAGFGLVLVYLHPLVALWILDREIRRSRPEWRRAYHLCLAAVPLLLVILWWRLAQTPDLPGDDALTVRITAHAGAGVLHGISTHLLVATHTFLEMLHYGVWLLAIPLVSLRTAPWRIGSLPLARRSSHWKLLLGGMLIASAVVVLLLWGCFLADYPLTRDVYFTLAIAHVLAEFPFLLRML